MKKILIIFFIFPCLILADEACEISLGDPSLDEYVIVAVDDTQIVTAEDLKYCPDQTTKNSHLTPESLPDNGSVWRVGNKRWNDDWEKEYQNWTKENYSGDFFEKLEFPTDCADAAIALRAIFAKIHNLPASFGGNKYKNTSKGYARYKTVKDWNKTSWQHDFKNDTRFKKALTNWLVNVGTVNLHKDTYQIDVWDEENNMPTACLAPGTVYLTEGHTEVVAFKKESIYPYRLSSSTVPSDVRPLAENIFQFNLGNDNYESNHLKNSRGYLWWNWIVNCKGSFIKVKDKDMPYYSEEQRNFDDNNSVSYDFNKVYQDSLGLSEEEIAARLEIELDVLIDEVEIAIDQRIKIVNDSLAYCDANGIDDAKDCFVPTGTRIYNGISYRFQIEDNGIVNILNHDDDTGDECIGDGCPEELPEHLKPENVVSLYNFEDLFRPRSKELGVFYHEQSTPSRDERLKNNLSALSSIYYSLPWEARERFELKLLDKKIDLGNGKTISYYHFKDMYYISPQPWDAKDKRWGSAEMPKVKRDFEQYKGYMLEELKKLTEENQIHQTEETKNALAAFKENNKVFIKEKEVIDEYFKDEN